MSEDELKAIEARGTWRVDGPKLVAEVRRLHAEDECQVDGRPPCHGDGKTEADWCRSCLLARYRTANAEVRQLKESLALSAVEAGVYLGAVSTVLNEESISIEDLERKMDSDAFAIVREGLRQLGTLR